MLWVAGNRKIERPILGASWLTDRHGDARDAPIRPTDGEKAHAPALRYPMQMVRGVFRSRPSAARRRLVLTGAVDCEDHVWRLQMPDKGKSGPKGKGGTKPAGGKKAGGGKGAR